MQEFGLPRNFAFQLHYLYEIICASLILSSGKSHFSRSISKTPTFEAETMREEISRTRNLIMATAERNAYTQIVRDKFCVYFIFLAKRCFTYTNLALGSRAGHIFLYSSIINEISKCIFRALNTSIDSTRSNAFFRFCFRHENWFSASISSQFKDMIQLFC